MQDNKNSLKKNSTNEPSLKKMTFEDFEELDFVEWIKSDFAFLNHRITLIDKNGEVVHTTANTEEIIGYRSNDFKLLSTFGYIHPDDRERVVRNFAEINITDFSKGVIYRIFTYDGILKWIYGIAKQYRSITNEIQGKFILEHDITTQMAEIQLIAEDTDDIYSDIVHLIDVPMIHLKNNTIAWANEALIEIFGHPFSDIQNKPIEFLFDSKDDYAAFLLESNRKLKSIGKLIFRTKLITKSNEEIEFMIQGITSNKDDLSKGINLFFIDLNVMRNELEINTEELDFFRKTLENYDGILFRILDGKILYVNKGIELLQYSPDEIIGKDIDILFETKEGVKQFRKDYNRSFALNQNFNKECIIYRKDRMPVPFTVRASPISYEKTNGFVLTLDPISDLKQTVNSLRDEKNEYEYFTDLLYHDVINLCQNALSQLDISLLQMDDSPDMAQERQRRSKMDIMRVAELISNMDKFFRIRRKGYDVQSYDLASVIKRVTDFITEKFDERKIILSHNIRSKKFFVEATELLDEIFINIISNALMYDRSEVLNIKAEVLDSTEYDGYWNIEIIFESPKIGQEIFRFLKGKRDKEYDLFSGSGFGIILVLTIIESCNGYIDVKQDSVINKSVISIHLPKYYK